MPFKKKFLKICGLIIHSCFASEVYKFALIDRLKDIPCFTHCKFLLDLHPLNFLKPCDVLLNFFQFSYHRPIDRLSIPSTALILTGKHSNNNKVTISVHYFSSSRYMPIFISVGKVVLLVYITSALIMSFPARTTTKTPLNSASKTTTFRRLHLPTSISKKYWSFSPTPISCASTGSKSLGKHPSLQIKCAPQF